MIEFGNPPVISFDETTNYASVYIERPEESVSVMDKLAVHLRDVKKAHVCLSGGVDSQFWLRVCSQLNIPVRATTYLSFWDGSPINTDDYVCAQLAAKKLNIEWDVVEINLNDLYQNSTLLNTAVKYRTASQQLAVHMTYLEQVANTAETFFVGGDCVFMCKGYPNNVHHGVSGRLNDLYVYKKFFDDNGIQFFKDVHLLEPELYYLMLRQSIEVVEKHQIHLDKEGTLPNVGADQFAVKSSIWENIIPGSISQLVKTTGFEKLKKHLAHSSGVYNYFDVKYRHPLRERIHRVHFQTDKVKVKTHNVHILSELATEFENAIVEHNSQSTIGYSFDF